MARENPSCTRKHRDSQRPFLHGPITALLRPYACGASNDIILTFGLICAQSDAVSPEDFGGCSRVFCFGKETLETYRYLHDVTDEVRMMMMREDEDDEARYRCPFPVSCSSNLLLSILQQYHFQKQESEKESGLSFADSPGEKIRKQRTSLMYARPWKTADSDGESRGTLPPLPASPMTQAMPKNVMVLSPEKRIAEELNAGPSSSARGKTHQACLDFIAGRLTEVRKFCNSYYLAPSQFVRTMEAFPVSFGGAREEVAVCVSFGGECERDRERDRERYRERDR